MSSAFVKEEEGGEAFEDLPEAIDGLPTTRADRGGPEAQHPNGAGRIDHLVASTPSLERTGGAFAAIGGSYSTTRRMFRVRRLASSAQMAP